MPPGSSRVMAEKYTGSYGSGTGEVTIRYLGEQTWEGRKLMAVTDGATISGTTLVETFEPYFVSFDWPLFVGKWWLNRYRYRDHERGRTFDNVQYDGKVEAYEDVTTPAGTLKAFKIVLGTRFLSSLPGGAQT